MEYLYPLIFEPIIKEKLWGGKNLNKILNKPRMSDHDGESWELSCVPDNVSVLRNGPLAGKTLTELIEQFRGDLVGEAVYEEHGSIFPLLIKFIDAQQDLSIQVHPDDELAKTRHNSFGKTEMWYVIDSEPDASIIVGFSEPLNVSQYLDYVENNKLMSILNRERVQPHDVFFIPAGRVHTIGKGLIIAEIQQTSDVTYRIHDFDRVDTKGSKRELHNDLAIEAIDFTIPDSYKTIYERSSSEQVIGTSNYFTTKRRLLNKSTTLNFDHSSCTVLICIEGSYDVSYFDELPTISKGDTVLVPSCIEELRLKPQSNGILLEIKIPY
ncbi:MAG: type I phosphomannose isomerase catalytic subunit [Bacteroidota bacterium]|nr:type I phosphomannose isomerase catalytic subunit [Bacteroidota bacterium]